VARILTGFAEKAAAALDRRGPISRNRREAGSMGRKEDTMPEPIRPSSSRPYSDSIDFVDASATSTAPAATPSSPARPASPPPASDEVLVVRIKSSAAKDGETYDACVARYRQEAADGPIPYVMGVAGAIAGGLGGYAAGVKLPVGLREAAAVGAAAGAATTAFQATRAGMVAIGEARGKKECDGAPGSPTELDPSRWETMAPGAGGAPASYTNGPNGADPRDGGMTCSDGRIVVDPRACMIQG
jgi:hypothetical protein